MWTRIPYSAKIGLPVRQYTGEAVRKPILPPQKTWTEKNGKKCTEHYGIPNFHRFRKSLATSTSVPSLDSSSQATYSLQKGTLDLRSTLLMNWPSGPGCNSRSRHSHGETITTASSEPMGHMHLQVSNPNTVHQHGILCTGRNPPVHGAACSIS